MARDYWAVVTGDCCGQLALVAHEQALVRIDRLFGMVADGAALIHAIASDLGRHDDARVAESMGCRGLRVQTLGGHGRPLDAIPGAKEPTLLDIVGIEDAIRSPLAKEGPGGK
jgi:thiamine pyrophosphate-dependent acetolactate synthase large subunit-like protein